MAALLGSDWVARFGMNARAVRPLSQSRRAALTARHPLSLVSLGAGRFRSALELVLLERVCITYSLF
jgi:hypothetical protein